LKRIARPVEIVKAKKQDAEVMPDNAYRMQVAKNSEGKKRKCNYSPLKSGR
jgi:hypothetical protein